VVAVKRQPLATNGDTAIGAPAGPRPPLKWAGGKRWLVPHLRPLVAAHRRRRLVEPLCGGLAVTLGLLPERALLNDINPHAVNFYRWLKRGLLAGTPMANDEALYYAQRERFNALIAAGQAESAESHAHAAEPFAASQRHAVKRLHDRDPQSTKTNSFRFSKTWQKSTTAAAWAVVGPSGGGIGKVELWITRDDGTAERCLACGKPRPPVAVQQGDDFCSTECARLYYVRLPRRRRLAPASPADGHVHAPRGQAIEGRDRRHVHGWDARAADRRPRAETQPPRSPGRPRLRQFVHCGRDVDDDPVPETASGRRIGIVARHREALRVGGYAIPLQVRRYVAARATHAVLGREDKILAQIVSVAEGGARQFQCQVTQPPPSA